MFDFIGRRDWTRTNAQQFIRGRYRVVRGWAASALRWLCPLRTPANPPIWTGIWPDPTTLRRAILLACVFGALAAGGFLQGCAGVAIHGYRWVESSTLPHCERMTWVQVRAEQVPGYCSTNGSPGNGVLACAVGCTVLSAYSEAEAKAVDLWGESLHDHEARHVFGRMRHPS